VARVFLAIVLVDIADDVAAPDDAASRQVARTRAISEALPYPGNRLDVDLLTGVDQDRATIVAAPRPVLDVLPEMQDRPRPRLLNAKCQRFLVRPGDGLRPPRSTSDDLDSHRIPCSHLVGCAG